LNLNPKTQTRRGLIIYNTTNGIVALRKHGSVDHSILFFKIKKKVNKPLQKEENNMQRREQICFNSFMSNFFVINELSRKMIYNKNNCWRRTWDF